MAEGYADAGGLAHEGSEDQTITDHAIEPRPIEIGQELPDQRGNIGHVGNAIGFTRRKRAGRFNQIGIEIGSRLAGGGGKAEHEQRHSATHGESRVAQILIFPASSAIALMALQA